MEKKFKVKLNSVEKVEALLQEIYDDSLRQLNIIQDKINELHESTPLTDEPIDMKAKYAKAMHDYLTDRDKCLGRKLDVSRLMAEVIKSNGDVEKVISESDIVKNLDDAFKNIRDDESQDDKQDKTEVYITNKIKK